MESVASMTARFNYKGVDLGEGGLALPTRITVGTEDSRAWFGRGWFHVLNYNHEEALCCFTHCLQVDPKCLMAHWGIAYSLSSNYNFPPGLGSGFDAIQAAISGIKTAGKGAYTELEEDLIRALAVRSSAESRAAINPAEMFLGNPPELNLKFAEEMGKLYAKYGSEDLDVAAMYAESVMVLKPWAMWVKDDTSGDIVPADTNTLLVKQILTKTMAAPGGMEHPAILHLFCHLMELSGEPEAAMPAADALRMLLPAAGHLTHMASHIDVWAGQYKAALDANISAIKADDATVVFTGVESNFYKAYRIHNIHMAIWAGMFTGQKEVAMRFARTVEDMLPPGDETCGVRFMFLGVIPFGRMSMEPYSIAKWHVMIRFGMWDDILSEPQYEDRDLYATGVASGHYARGLAYAAKGLIKEAEEEQAKYVEDMRSPALQGRRIHCNFVMTDDGPCILKVGEATLAGEIEYRKGNFEAAFNYLREAVRRDVGLNYDEPWGWMVPAEHALGALLLERGYLEEATAVFRSNLKMYKENMWGLLGLYQCLEKAGDPQADQIKLQFDRAAMLADVKPTATCFCAEATGACPPVTAAVGCCHGD